MTNYTVRRAFVLLAILALFMGAVWSFVNRPVVLQPGELMTLDGAIINGVQSLARKEVIILVWWDRNCADCKELLQTLDGWDFDALQVIAIHVGGNPRQVKRAVERINLKRTEVVIGSRPAVAGSGRLPVMMLLAMDETGKYVLVQQWNGKPAPSDLGKIYTVLEVMKNESAK